MTTTLNKQLADVRQKESKILEQIDEKRMRKRIQCSCGSAHRIMELKAIQTHWYHTPHGCTGGDYWSEGELQFICPNTEVKNRLLFNVDDLPWEERKHGYPAEQQFKHRYRKLFKEVQECYEDKTPGKWKNNYYVDQHRKMFGLDEKRK